MLQGALAKKEKHGDLGGGFIQMFVDFSSLFHKKNVWKMTRTCLTICFFSYFESHQPGNDVLTKLDGLDLGSAEPQR